MFSYRILPSALLLALYAAALCLPTAHAQRRDTGPVMVYDRDSRYYRIQVVDYPDTGRRTLRFSKARSTESQMLLADPIALDFAYSRSMMAAFALRPAPKSVLLIGLGGASIPKFIQDRFPGVALDIVEIDPDILKVSQDYFFFKPGKNTRVFIVDGRIYLKKSDQKYDVIMIDAFAGDRIPFHMTTLEFMALVKERLQPDGVFAMNIWEPVRTRFYAAELQTCRLSFPQTYSFRCEKGGNTVVFATMSEEKTEQAEWMARARALAAETKLGFDMAALIGREYAYMTNAQNPENPLTDDAAPVDTLRREHPKYFDQEQGAQ